MSGVSYAGAQSKETFQSGFNIEHCQMMASIYISTQKINLNSN